MSSIFNINIAFSGPECLGDRTGGFAARWWTNAMAPVVLIVLHALVFCVRLARAGVGKREELAWAALGSWTMWCKLIVSIAAVVDAFDSSSLICSSLPSA